MAKPIAPIRWTLSKAAAEFNIDAKTLSKRLRAESIEPGDDGMLSTSQIVIAIVGDLEREKTRDTSAAADIREMTRDVMRQGLIKVEVFRAILEEVGIAIRQVIDHSSLAAREKELIHANIRKLGETDYAAKVAKQLETTDEPDQ